MEKWIQERIREIANKIRAENEDTKIFGVAIDWTDPDMAIVAAHCIGQAQVRAHIRNYATTPPPTE